MNYNELRKAYKKAENEKYKTFELDGWRILTSYAKSLIKDYESYNKRRSRESVKAVSRGRGTRNT